MCFSVQYKTEERGTEVCMGAGALQVISMSYLSIYLSQPASPPASFNNEATNVKHEKLASTSNVHFTRASIFPKLDTICYEQILHFGAEMLNFQSDTWDFVGSDI